jgi:hypothetical protein
MTTTWFIWHPETIMVYSFIGAIIYLVVTSKNEEINKYIKKPIWFGIIIPILSFFDIGLYAFLTIILYCMEILIIDYIREKVNTK